MLDQRIYRPDEITEIIHFAHQADNMEAVVEASDHLKLFGKTVKVVKGRKVPIGTIGDVFYLARKHYSQNTWFGFDTRIGIKSEDGTQHFLSASNVEAI